MRRVSAFHEKALCSLRTSAFKKLFCVRSTASSVGFHKTSVRSDPLLHATYVGLHKSSVHSTISLQHDVRSTYTKQVLSVRPLSFKGYVCLKGRKTNPACPCRRFYVGLAPGSFWKSLAENSPWRTESELCSLKKTFTSLVWVHTLSYLCLEIAASIIRFE